MTSQWGQCYRLINFPAISQFFPRSNGDTMKHVRGLMGDARYASNRMYKSPLQSEKATSHQHSGGSQYLVPGHTTNQNIHNLIMCCCLLSSLPWTQFAIWKNVQWLSCCRSIRGSVMKYQSTHDSEFAVCSAAACC